MKKREEFWKELNETRSKGLSRYWPGIFPEASILDFNLLVEVNQYLFETRQYPDVQNFIRDGSAVLGPAHTDSRVKTFLIEFIENYNRIDTETEWNSHLFFSLSDNHHSVDLHKDAETVFLIQGYGECAYITNKDSEGGSSKKDIHRMNTGDVLLLPPYYAHKPIPLGPRITLSINGVRGERFRSGNSSTDLANSRYIMPNLPIQE